MKPVKKSDIEVSTLQNGDIILAYPLSVRSSLKPFLSLFGLSKKEPVIKKIQLDTLGAFVWQQIDGNRSIRDIIVTFSRKYNMMEIESEISVTQFIRVLGQKGLIGLSDG